MPEIRTKKNITPEEEILRQRKDKLRRLREEAGYDPFVKEKWPVKDKVVDIRKKFDHLEVDECIEDDVLVIGGRLTVVRKQGRASFAHIDDGTSTIQLYFQLDRMGEEDYRFTKKWMDAGDIVGIKGYPFRTRKGELTIAVTECSLLSKALRPLPEKWHGLKDTEIRYRQRYIDLIVNRDVREVFRKRASVIKAIRNTLEAHGTLEVETPTLSAIAGGANAKPFITHHNSLDIDMYLRIATELHLKRLIVGMMDRVYEIGKNFRNEGMDTMHNPEFTSVEVYWAYADYEDIMNLTEELVRAAADAVGERKVDYQGNLLDFDAPFKRASMLELVKEHCGVDFAEIIDDDEARNIARDRGVEIQGNESRFVVLSKMFDEFVEDKLIQPTFVTGHPTEISPLAKRDPENPDFTHRFELFIAGSEVANAFSELNDPLDQRERFEDQMSKRAAGDEEACELDEDFLCALEYGLPPTGGLGIGIDRLVMFLTNSRSIRDVLLFPTMRPKA